MQRLAGHVALVTGGARGIGRAISGRLYEEGAQLAICDTSADVLAQAAQEIATDGREVFRHCGDIARPGEARAIVEAVARRFGKLDILINNAAVTLSEFGRERISQRFDQIDEEVWDRNLTVNLKAPWLLARAAYPYMVAQRWGRIVNIGSSTVYSGRGNGAPYIASKAGLVGLTRVLAMETGADGVTVNCVSAGLTMTERMLEHGYLPMAEGMSRTAAIPRVQTPQDLVGTVAYLASDDAAFVTGQVISVDGGRSFH